MLVVAVNTNNQYYYRSRHTGFSLHHPPAVLKLQYNKVAQTSFQHQHKFKLLFYSCITCHNEDLENFYT